MRRIRVNRVVVGPVALDASEAHHARDVLRLGEGDEVEVFDEDGLSGDGIITRCVSGEVIVEVRQVHEAKTTALEWVVASAVPKGSRGDWMIEKLSELGTAGFVPLAAERSVVLPEGKGKRDRWQRLAAESAKQSRRAGVMRIEELTPVGKFIERIGNSTAWYFSTTGDAVNVGEAMRRLKRPAAGSAMMLNLLIGPEGGWTEREMEAFAKAGLTAVTLGATILRVETAAVAAAAIAAAVLTPQMESDFAKEKRP